MAVAVFSQAFRAPRAVRAALARERYELAGVNTDLPPSEYDTLQRAADHVQPTQRHHDRGVRSHPRRTPCRSDRTATTTSPGPGSGTSTSTSSTGAPLLRATTPRTCCGILPAFSGSIGLAEDGGERGNFHGVGLIPSCCADVGIAQPSARAGTAVIADTLGRRRGPQPAVVASLAPGAPTTMER